MRAPDEDGDEPLLFDLPLGAPARRSAGGEAPAGRKRAEPRRERPAALEPADLPLVEPPPSRRSGPVALPAEPAPAPAEPDAATEPAPRHPVRSRLAAGAADLLVHAAIAVVALVGAHLMGIRPALSDAPAVLLFLLSFSFLYLVVPLAFWGQTLGMVWAGLAAQNRDGDPLAFDQTVRRWLGALLTTATLGLPILLAGRRRTLTDLLSGSETRFS
jgi:uncharacterized RDD family membrane protein YckC